MNKVLRKNLKKRLGIRLSLTVLLIANVPLFLCAQTNQFLGVTTVLPGQTETYSYTKSSGNFVSPNWTVLNGGKLSTTVSSDRLTATVTVKWTTGGSAAYVQLTDGATNYGQYNVTVNNCPSLGVPATPTLASSVICGGYGNTITSSPGSAGNSVRWYSTSTASAELYIGNSYGTGQLWATKTYYLATAITNSGCVGSRIPVTVNVNPAPKAPLDVTSTFVYGKGQVTLLSEIFVSGEDVKWYSSETGSTFLAQGSTYTTPELTASKEYYFTAVNLTTLCESVPRAKITARVLTYLTPSSVKTEIIHTEGIKQDNQLYTLNESQKTVLVSHQDGLMRSVQQLVLKSSPGGKDIISATDYDAQGNAIKNYLPYTEATNPTTPGAFRNFYKTEQPAFYNNASDNIADDPMAFSTGKFEESPLGRITESGAPGADWQPGSNHTQRYKYSYNTGSTASEAEEVRKFNSDGTSTGYYLANILSRLEKTDENGKKEIIFTDPFGNLIVRKKQLDEAVDNSNSTVIGYLQTYYIYDEQKRIKYILPPKGLAALKANTWNPTQTILDNHAYQFVYDKRGRLIEKKVPGQAWMYYGYDRLNRLVLAQDGLLKAQNKWIFLKYDRSGRNIMNGVYTNTTHTTRATVQLNVLDPLYANATDKYYEDRGTAQEGYTNQSFPTSGVDEVWSVNYYDSYDMEFDNVVEQNYVSQSLQGESAAVDPFGLPTASKRKIPGTSTWLRTYVFYDKFDRPVQVRSNNHLNPTQVDNLVTTVYDYSGKALVRKVYHNAGAGKQTTVVNTFSYDDKGRLIAVKQANNGAPNYQEVARYTYNELGQLVDKKLHNTSGTNYLQSVDYRFTIRGWLASINNSQLTNDGLLNDDAGDYFGIEFLHNKLDGSGLANAQRYDGTISAAKWKRPGAASGAEDQQSYKFTYDNAGQLKSAVSQSRVSGTWTGESGALNETIFYDLNGNIRKLQRNQRTHALDVEGFGIYVSGGMDDLTYTYSSTIGDQLLKVEDAVAGTAGFVNGSTVATEYTYDVNGNVLRDLNKGITTDITYNYLGKPTVITFGDGRKIEYTYDAAGVKLTTKTYIAGGTLQTTTDYVGGFVYENGILSFYSSPEGRVVGKEDVNLMTNTDATSTSGYPASGVAAVSAVTISGETYVKVESNTTTSTPGVHPIGGTFTVQAGNRYILKVKGYANRANAYLRAYTNLGNIMLSSTWKGAQLPVGASNEGWITNDFIIPKGATTLQVSVLWSGPADTDEMYINKVELHKTTEEYHYAIADHQGNTRVLFSSVVPLAQTAKATFESASNSDFENYPTTSAGRSGTFEEFDHTDAPAPTGTATYSQMLNGGNGFQVGVAKSYKVYPGDKIKVDAYAKYISTTSTNPSDLGAFATAITGAFGLSASSTGEALKAYNAVNNYGGLVSGGDGHGSNAGDPKGFVTIVLFDKNYNFLDAAWDQLDDSYAQVVGQPKVAHDLLTKEVTVQEEGHAYVFISNESPTAIDIYFDDVTMTYTPSNVLQYNEYYPYGLQTSASWTRENSKNNFLYNAGSELNVTSGWYDLAFRNYDAALGRFMQVDPMSVSEQATYQYAGNNPVSFNDPLGLKKDSDSWGFYNKWVAKQDFAAAHSRAVAFSQWCSSWFGGSSDVLGDGFEGGGGYGRSSQYYSAMKAFAREQATFFQQEFSRATTAAREAAESVLEYVGKDIAGYRLGVLLDNGEISSIIINSVDECGNSLLSPIIFDIESGYVGAGDMPTFNAGTDEGGFLSKVHWHFGSESTTTYGRHNYDFELKNGFGAVWREGAEVVREISADSYYSPTNTSFPNSKKYVTEIGAYFEGGFSYQSTVELGLDGSLIDQNSQFNVGAYLFGVQINWDSKGLKDIRVGFDTGFGFSVIGGQKVGVQMGLIYTNRPPN